MKRTSLLLSLACGCLVAMLAGCDAGDAGHRAAVKGEVTLDGKPLAQGAIRFTPLEGTPGVVTGTSIKDGRFELPAEIGAAVGWNRVEITGMKKSGKKVQDPFGPPGQMVEMETSAVAPRFNVSSTLKLEVKAGDNAAPFAVESK
jgi:hypothetical protein